MQVLWLVSLVQQVIIGMILWFLIGTTSVIQRLLSMVMMEPGTFTMQDEHLFYAVLQWVFPPQVVMKCTGHKEYNTMKPYIDTALPDGCCRAVETDGLSHDKDAMMKDVNLLHICLFYLATINIVAFFIYGIDKWKAKRSKWRISEATLLVVAVLGGSIGAWLGMKTWHHKTLHKKFRFGVPLILTAQILLLIYIFNK